MSSSKRLSIIKEFYEQKKERNPKFSIRALGNYFEIDGPSMNRMLSGKRKITDKMFLKFANKMNLTDAQVKQILGEKENVSPEEQYKEIQEEQFKIISEWYHYAILKMTKLKEFKNDYKWMANLLGIKAYEAEEAVERLLNLNFLKIDENGKLIDISGGVNISKPKVASVLKHQKGILSEAYRSVSDLPANERAHCTLTLAVNKKKMEYVKERMRIFRAEIDKFLSEPNEDKDDVYHLSVSYFPARRIAK